MHFTGPSKKQYHLDELGDLDCDVTFTIHPHTPHEEEVIISMRDVLFLAALHFRTVRSAELDHASDLKILGLEEG